MSSQATLLPTPTETEPTATAEQPRLLNVGDLIREALAKKCPLIIDTLTGYPCIRLIARGSDVFARTLRHVEHVTFAKDEFTAQDEDWAISLLVHFMRQGFLDISKKEGE